jgi:hypothetical protein
LREADFGCARYDACYDPAPASWAPWGWPEFLILILFIILLLLILSAFLKPAEKPKPTIKTAVIGVINDLEKQADLWNRPEAGAALRNARGRIEKEFDDRSIT